MNPAYPQPVYVQQPLQPVAQPVQVQIQTTTPAVPVVGAGAAFCANHPGVPANEQCYRCGRNLCLNCQMSYNTYDDYSVYCSTCYYAARRNNIIYSGIALFIFCCCFIILPVLSALFDY